MGKNFDVLNLTRNSMLCSRHFDKEKNQHRQLHKCWSCLLFSATGGSTSVGKNRKAQVYKALHECERCCLKCHVLRYSGCLRTECFCLFSKEDKFHWGAANHQPLMNWSSAGGQIFVKGNFFFFCWSAIFSCVNTIPSAIILEKQLLCHINLEKVIKPFKIRWSSTFHNEKDSEVENVRVICQVTCFFWVDVPGYSPPS